MPFGAIEAVEDDDGTSVRLRVTGEDTSDGFRVSGNTSAVRAFRAELERAMADTGPAPTGGTPTVSVTVRPRTFPRPAPPWSWLMYGIGCYLVHLLLLIIVNSPEQRGFVIRAAIMGPLGVGVLAYALFCAREPWLLGRRGITVPGEVVGYSQGNQMAMNPGYRFTTVEGVTLTQRSNSMVLARWRDPHIDVVYDPRDPTRVRGGRGVAHLVLTLLIGLIAAGLLTPTLVVFGSAVHRLFSS
ncbi:hypothetical protein ACFWPV_20690 [Streptomyces uncialis]|uniref:hypothetical protein n=1 Tax=Streptomyces uncialis TaxID=1048205 RepID=UPI0036653C35